jgi:hypothetical protein
MSKSRNIVVDSPSKIGKFEDTVKSGKISIVLVYAEWCGACHRFRKNVWDPMLKRNAIHNRIEIRDDMVKNSPVSKDWKFDYLPSLIVVDEKGVAQTFQQPDGSMKNAMKTPKDVKEMTRIVNVPVEANKDMEKDEIVEDELVKDELVEDELVEDKLAEDELAKDELVEDELAEDELAKDELAKDEIIRMNNQINKNNIMNNKMNKNISMNTLLPKINTKMNNSSANINTLLSQMENMPQRKLDSATNSLNLARNRLTEADIVPTKPIVKSSRTVYIPTHEVAPQRGGSLFKSMNSFIHSRRKTRRMLSLKHRKSLKSRMSRKPRKSLRH